MHYFSRAACLAAATVTIFSTAAISAPGAPAREKIRYDNSLICAAYMNLAIGYAQGEAEAGRQDVVGEIEAAAADYLAFAISSGAAVGDDKAAVEKKVEDAKADLNTGSELLDEEAFDQADTDLFNHCAQVGAGKPNEFIPYHLPWADAVDA